MVRNEQAKTQKGIFAEDKRRWTNDRRASETVSSPLYVYDTMKINGTRPVGGGAVGRLLEPTV